MELPTRITKRWLKSLSRSNLFAVERLLAQEDGYQSYAHARTISNQWLRAWEELEERGLVRKRPSRIQPRLAQGMGQQWKV